MNAANIVKPTAAPLRLLAMSSPSCDRVGRDHLIRAVDALVDITPVG